MKVAIDFETYAATSLPDHGLYNYVHCPTFKVLCASVIINTDDGIQRSEVFDFITDEYAMDEFSALLMSDTLVTVIAHNAAFEKAVLKQLGFPVDDWHFRDTAHIARMAGANSSLANASRQLLGKEKHGTGDHLVKLFCMPGPLQEKNQSLEFDPEIVKLHPAEWREMVHTYCVIDTKLARDIFKFDGTLVGKEYTYWAYTDLINQNGWFVDIPLVTALKQKWEHNCEELRALYPGLNFNSHKQLVKFCKDRGVNARSFDELNVKKMLKRIDAKMKKEPDNTSILEVHGMLLVKQELGGSSLKKLDKILDNICDDHRLRGQYIHFGAGQTGRTSGQSVQMQNLKRLKDPIPVEELMDLSIKHTNTELAENIRQVFKAEKGVLLTGDYSAIESRALAWLANEEWKLEAYREGRGVYEELASRMLAVPLDQIDKTLRGTGKLGELSCGYGAGGVAVKDFAEKLGTVLAEEEAVRMVHDWRNACPNTVNLWETLREAMFQAATTNRVQLIRVGPPDESYRIQFTPVLEPTSLNKPGAMSIHMVMLRHKARKFSRVFHGVHVVGRDIRYFKPTSNKGGPAWSDTFINPKTKRREHYKLHGGKLAGILTQSLCREIFFQGVLNLVNWTKIPHPYELKFVGQFHDEANIELTLDPGSDQQPEEVLKKACNVMAKAMQSQVDYHGLPVVAEVNYSERYIK